MRKNKAPLICLLTALSLLNGCQLMLSDYQRPELPYVESFYLADKYLGEDIKVNFWEGFKDPKLTAIIERALVQNLDLQKAALNVEKALLQVDISYQDRVPTLSGSASERTSKNLDSSQAWTKSSGLSLSLSYAADLFSKISASNRSSYESYRSTAYDFWAMRLTVIKTVSSAYWQYAWALENLKLARGDLKDSQKRVNLIDAQYHQGAVSNVEVDRAQINHLQVKKSLDAAEHELNQARSALNILLGETADHEQEVGSLSEARPPAFSLDVPARLLSRRPDLVSKEALLRKALADYDSARLAFYPDFTLSLGFSSGDTVSFGRFLSNPVSSLGAALTMPFLNWHKLSLSEESAKKSEDLAALDFVNRYLTAVQEVYDQVSAIDYYRKSVKLVSQTLKLARRNYEAYYDRYSQGGASLTDLLDAADTLRSTELSYLNAKRDALQSVMGLMVALGGDTDKTGEIEEP